MVAKKGGERTMELLKRLVVEEEGQGLVEYSLIVLLVALVFWVAIQGTNADDALSNAWNDIVACLNAGVTSNCAAGS
jgi:Flp pilus assembly pilin Flp